MIRRIKEYFSELDSRVDELIKEANNDSHRLDIIREIQKLILEISKYSGVDVPYWAKCNSELFFQIVSAVNVKKTAEEIFPWLKSIDELNLSDYVINVLKDMDIFYAGELIQFKPSHFIRSKKLSPKYISELKVELSLYNLKLGTEMSESWSNYRIHPMQKNFRSLALRIETERYLQNVVKTIKQSIIIDTCMKEDNSQVNKINSSEVDFNIPTLSIDKLNLSVRSTNCLRIGNIKLVSDLVQMKEYELLKIRNFG